jgi:hypothetical protein
MSPGQLPRRAWQPRGGSPSARPGTDAQGPAPGLHPRRRAPSAPCSPCPSFPEQLIGGVGGRPPHRRDHGRVVVHRERDGAVPEPLADGLRVNAGGEQLRRVSVSQIVEPCPWQLELASNTAEVRRDRPRCERPADRIGQDDAVVLPAGLPGLPDRERYLADLGGGRRNRHANQDDGPGARGSRRPRAARQEQERGDRQRSQRVVPRWDRNVGGELGAWPSTCSFGALYIPHLPLGRLFGPTKVKEGEPVFPKRLRQHAWQGRRRTFD